jgi:hypothetical protein
MALVVAISSSSSEAKPVVSSDEAVIRRQLIERLHHLSLKPRWVACIPSGMRFERAAVIRCNVNFGDPHIEAFCSVLRDGRLVTNGEDAAIPCGHDNAGWRAPVRTFG